MRTAVHVLLYSTVLDLASARKYHGKYSAVVEIAWQSSVLKFQVLGVQNFGGLEISRLRIAYDFDGKRSTSMYQYSATRDP